MNGNCKDMLEDGGTLCDDRMGMTIGHTPLTVADDSYTHQVVAPAAATAYADPAWAERCWHVVHVGDGWMAGAGRAVWPHGGRRTARAGVNTGNVQLSRRVEEPFALGDDPNRGDVGPVRIETVEPLREFRLVLDEPGGSTSGSTSPTAPARSASPATAT